MFRRLVVLLFLVCTEGGVPPPAFASSDCMQGLRTALIAGGYSGSMDCSSVKFEIRKVVVKSGSNFPFSVYDLKYRTIPQGLEVAHGGERLLIFKDEKYVGQYVLSPPPFSAPTIIGDEILLEGMPVTDGNVIRLTKNELPSKAWIDGFIVELVK